MSDHPEVPRVTFDDDGESMNVEQAVTRFRELLSTLASNAENDLHCVQLVRVEVRPCDCDDDINGRDEYCPLHGDKS